MQTSEQILSDKLLHKFAERAGVYDRENRFFHEDFDDLRHAGYLTMPVPKELGGAGLTLAEVCREQRRLGYYAPATALGINMHLYWVGLAADLWRQGDRSLEWMLKEAMAGEVFNAGHSERGNDLPVLLSTSKAERVDGGFRFTGHKMFGSLMPVWTRMGLHATWADAEGGPKIVHAFLPRDYDGWRMVETWDTMGMRATRSDDTMLEGAFVPDKYIARIVPAGGADDFVARHLRLGADGLRQHLLRHRAAGDRPRPAGDQEQDLARGQPVDGLPSRKSSTRWRRWRWPSTRSARISTGSPRIGRTASITAATWPAKIVSAKYHAVEACWRIVDKAMEVSGGAGMFRGNELERLFRDARCGRFHPANTFLVHEIVAKTALGIDLGEQPRWG